MPHANRIVKMALVGLMLATGSFIQLPVWGASSELRFDCGTGDSPIMDGYRRLTAADAYSEQKGYGW